ncbi:MAG: ferritin family protein [bacterium]
MDRKKVYGPHEAVTLGIELENAGYHFYTRVADASVDFRVTELFTALANAELEHLRVIKEEIQPNFTPEWYREEDQQLMAEYLRKFEEQPVFPSPDEAQDFAAITNNIGRAVDTSIEAEKRAMAYFEYLRDVTLDSYGREAFDRLYREEEKHLKLLIELKKSL